VARHRKNGPSRLPGYDAAAWSGSAHTILAVDVASLAMVGGAVRLVIGLREYPPPPPSFKTTPDVEALFYHYESYLDAKERLSDMNVPGDGC
jgi:hypothetical protein